MTNDEKSKDSRESIQKRSHWAQLDHFWGKWMVDCIRNGLCYMQLISVFTDGNKLDSKNDGFWFKSVHRWHHQFDDLKHQGVGQKMMTG